jgi:hypothetical protein
MRSQATKELTTRALMPRQQLGDIERILALRSQGKEYPQIRELGRVLSLELSEIRALLAQHGGSILEGGPDEQQQAVTRLRSGRGPLADSRFASRGAKMSS